MAKMIVHAGDFPKGKGSVILGVMTFPCGPRDVFTGQTIPVTELERVEIATEESVKKAAGTVGWGVAGSALLGPVGLLAGLLLGGRKTEVTFVARLKDGRKFLGTTDKGAYNVMLAGTFSKGVAGAPKRPSVPPPQPVTPCPEVRVATKRNSAYDVLEVNRGASKEMIDAAYGVLSKAFTSLAEMGSAEAQSRLTIVKSAYAILSNPRKKALYDERLDRETPALAANSVVAIDTKAPSDCPKCGSKNWKPASAVYKLFLQPEPEHRADSSGEPVDDTPRGLRVSGAERLRLYKAAAPPNSFKRTSVLLGSTIVLAPAGWFFGPQWLLLFAMLGVATAIAYSQDSKRNGGDKVRWKSLVMCMECGHTFFPHPIGVLEVQREKQLAKMRGAEEAARARQWRTFAAVAGAVFAVLLASSAMWPRRPAADEVRSTSLSAPSARVDYGQGDSALSPSARAVVVGTSADRVLALRGKALSTIQTGRDSNGLLVEWEYADATYLMGRSLQDGVEMYRVIKITPKP